MYNNNTSGLKKNNNILSIVCIVALYRVTLYWVTKFQLLIEAVTLDHNVQKWHSTCMAVRGEW